MKKYTINPRIVKSWLRRDRVVYDIYKRVSDDVYRFGHVVSNSKYVRFHTCDNMIDSVKLRDKFNKLESENEGCTCNRSCNQETDPTDARQ